MSVGGLFSIGSSALTAAYAQLQTTSHNIANVNTPGFSRQETILATAGGTFSGGGFFGRGVDVADVVRRYDSFLVAEVNTSAASAAGDRVRAEQLGELDRMFADTGNGIGVAIDDMNSALADVVNRPFDGPARSVFLSRAGVLAERIGDAAATVESMRDTVDLRLTQVVQGLNADLTQLAGINARIAIAQGTGKAPNDLLDQRDAMVARINESMKATAFMNPDGTVSLFSASGQAMLVGSSISTFSTRSDPLDPSKLQLVLNTSGVDIPVPTRMIGGGAIDGLLRFRDDDLEAARTRLGQLAGAIAWAYNEQQSLGLDASGAQGTDLFSVDAPTIAGATDNTGNALFSATVVDGTQLVASDFRLDYDGANFTLTRLSDGTQTAIAGFPQTVDGIAIDMTAGAPAAGDSFLLRAASRFGTSFEVAMTSGARLATAYAVTTQASATNTGDAAARNFAVVANDPNLTAAVTITFDGAGTFSVTGTGTGDPVGLPYTPGMTVSYNGWSMRLAGVPGAGDTLSIVPIADPSADNRNARTMIRLPDVALVDGLTFSSAFADLLSDVGVRTNSAQTLANASERGLIDARAAQAEVSGVNLDEEAARLMHFQQAYQAAAKLLVTAQTIFDTLLQATQ